MFDTTLKNAKQLKKLCPNLRLSLSIGEDKNFPDTRYPTIYRYEQVKSKKYWDIVWGDEWEDGLYSEEFLNKIHKDKKIAYFISPELHRNTNSKHPLSEQGYELLWKKLIKWGVDGICTDYPDKFKKIR